MCDEFKMYRIIEADEDMIKDLQPKYTVADENRLQDYYICMTVCVKYIRKDSLEHLPVVGHYCLYKDNYDQGCVPVYKIEKWLYISETAFVKGV
jgi:hypothetical protein